MSTRRLSLVSLLLTTLVLGACGEKQAPPARGPSGPLVLSPILLLGVNDRGPMMSVPRMPLLLDNDQTVTTCIEYIKARIAGANPKAEGQKQEAPAEYMICDALEAVQRAEPLQHAASMNLGEQVAQRLDLRSALGESHPRVQTGKRTLQEFGKSVNNVDLTSKLDDGLGHTRFEVIARADFDEDRKLDWLVWMIDEPRKGRAQYKTLVVSNVEGEGLVSAKEYRPG